MTDEQIIKALECCTTELSCDDCSYKDADEACYTDMRLHKDVLDLINRQKAKIENLNTVNADMHESLRLACEINKDLQAEIERLKLITTNKPYCVSIGTADIFTENHEEYEWLLAKISAEAIKEFAEKLKMANTTKLTWFNEDIDNLVKEMVGEG